MANWSDPDFNARNGMMAARTVAVDAGLRSYMLSVYNYMTSAVLLTGVVAALFAQTGIALAIFSSPLAIFVKFLPLAFVVALAFGIQRMSTSTAQIVFWVYSISVGAALSWVPLRFTGTSIAEAFFATSAAYAGLSLYGYTTKRDLGPIGAFLVMALFGLIVAMLINAFFPTPGATLVISLIGVLIFAGLTAYDTQRVKSLYFQVAGTDMLGKVAILGALTLYLDFINMFMFILRLMGDRR